MIVLFHGASGTGAGVLDLVAPASDSIPAVIVAPDSLRQTWDALSTDAWTLLDLVTSRRRLTGGTEDLQFVDNVLDDVFRTVAIDASRVVIAGFSDGATYALSLGLHSGDLASRIVAFSPGFVLPGPRMARPAVFISHGRGDRILPIDRAARRIVADLRDEGLDVTYREFEGGHGVPPAIAREAMMWATR